MHERPYRAHGINGVDQVEVTEQAQVHFSIGPYEDSLWCDIIPIVDYHLILGGAWHIMKHTLHDGAKNTYTFLDRGRRVVLHPLKDGEEGQASQVYDIC